MPKRGTKETRLPPSSVRERFPVFWNWELRLSLALFLVAIVADFGLHIHGIPLFAIGAIALIPLAALLGKATEELAIHAGPGMGGLLNATFGNAAELILALIALSKGLHLLVQASLIGSILGNILFILGISMVVGGLKYKIQTFNRHSASVQLSMLMIAAGALAMPTMLKIVDDLGLDPYPTNRLTPGEIQFMSDVVAVILIGTYALGLLFSYKTHKDIFNPVREAHAKAEWSTGLAVTVLLGATALVAIIAEIVVGEAEGLVKGGGIGLSEIFLGVIVIAIIGNAAEHATAILFAWKNDLTLSVEIAASSSTQVALFLTPLIVLAALVITPGVPLTLVFPPMLIGALVFAVVVVNMIVADGEANWFEGVQLLSVYAILAAFLYYVH